jgi:hypothetical protein
MNSGFPASALLDDARQSRPEAEGRERLSRRQHGEHQSPRRHSQQHCYRSGPVAKRGLSRHMLSDEAEDKWRASTGLALAAAASARARGLDEMRAVPVWPA